MKFNEYTPGAMCRYEAHSQGPDGLFRPDVPQSMTLQRFDGPSEVVRPWVMLVATLPALASVVIMKCDRFKRAVIPS